MEYKSSEIKAGFFIFASFIVLAVMVFMLGNLQDYFKPKRQLRISFNYTGGLEIGAPVRYAGMAIGRVVNVELSSEKDRAEHVVVVTAIDPSINIKKNSIAMIKTSGLMGGLYIELRPGSANAATLEANEPLRGQESFEITKIGDIMTEFMTHIERFTDIAETLAIDSKTTLTALQGSLANIDLVINENRDNLHANLKNMTKISGELAGLMDKNDGEIRKTLANVASLAKKTDSLLNENEGEIRKALAHVAAVAQKTDTLLGQNGGEIRETMTHVAAITQKTDALLSQNDGEIRETLTHVASLAQKTDTLMSRKEQSISDIIDQTQRTTREIELLLKENRPGVTNLVRSVESSSQRVADKIESVAGNVEQALQQTNGVLIENRRNLLELVKNLKETTESLKEFSDDIKRNPWKLIRKTDEQPEQGKPAPAGNQDSLRMKRLDKVSSK